MNNLLTNNAESLRARLFTERLSHYANRDATLVEFLHHIQKHLKLYCYCSNRAFAFDAENVLDYAEQLGIYQKWTATQRATAEIERLIKLTSTTTKPKRNTKLKELTS